MSYYWKATSIAWLALLSLVPPASAQRRVFVSGGVGLQYPYSGPIWGWGCPGCAPELIANTGEVKIKAAKDALVYVDDGYAGTAGKLKKFPLPAGTHTIELRDPSGHPYRQERIHVIRGKTVEVDGGAVH